jgi:hypothetical protein
MQRHFGLALSLLTLVLTVTSSAGLAFTSRHSSSSAHTTHSVQQQVSHHSRHRSEPVEHEVTQYSGSSRHTSRVRHSTLRHVARSHHHETHSAHTRYAYSVDLFLAKPPTFDTSPLPEGVAGTVRGAFSRGRADSYSPRTLVKAGVVSYHPIRGGIFWRRQPVKYIIIHSTETGIPQGAVRVIEAWSSLGRRHPGAQYVVDRDGTIYQALDPDLASVHVNIFKTLPGINNDDSVGIEMCHAGHQDYPPSQVDSVIKLVVYLQNHYHVSGDNIVTHRYAQQGDHTDPVFFDWNGFISAKNTFLQQALAMKMSEINKEAISWIPDVTPPSENFLQIHKQLKAKNDAPSAPMAVTLPKIYATDSEDKRPRHQLDSSQIINPLTPQPKAGATPELRGPIEMSPGAASILHNMEPPKEAPKSPPQLEQHDVPKEGAPPTALPLPGE